VRQIGKTCLLVWIFDLFNFFEACRDLYSYRPKVGLVI
jgi:hypothetical protein